MTILQVNPSSFHFYTQISSQFIHTLSEGFEAELTGFFIKSAIPEGFLNPSLQRFHRYPCGQDRLAVLVQGPTLFKFPLNQESSPLFQNTLLFEQMLPNPLVTAVNWPFIVCCCRDQQGTNPMAPWPGRTQGCHADPTAELYRTTPSS